MTLDLNKHLKALISIGGPSGYEKPVRDLIAETWRPLSDELTITNLGSLKAVRHGSGAAPRPTVMLAAHMDAIGLMVTQIDSGFLRTTQIGGVDSRILPGQMVTVHATRNQPVEIPGMVVLPADFLLPAEAGHETPPLNHLLVDTGLRADEIAALVRVGDVISFAQEPLELSGASVAGHTLDNRASVAAVSVCLDLLSRRTHLWDVAAVATVQEEVGAIGAAVDPVAIHPDFAIVIDVTFANGPGGSGWRKFELGKGVPLTWGINDHPALYQALTSCAEELDIPIEKDLAPRGSGTDAYSIQVVESGIPVVEVGIPLRYMHTPVEMVALKDIRRAGRLMAEFIADLPLDFMSKVLWE